MGNSLVRRCWVAIAIAGLVAMLSSNPALGKDLASEGEGVPDIARAVFKDQSVVVTITTTHVIRPRKLSTAFEGADDHAESADLGAAPAVVPRRPDQERVLGSGFIISSEGEIITNAHVVSDADEASVRLFDGRVFTGRVIGLDQRTDVALLKIEARDLPVAVIGESTRLAAGQWVVAVGTPFGLDKSVSAGIVSNPQRILPGQSSSLIQTDVPVSPGSSGGPLFNLQGEVVGINSLIFSTSEAFMGVSFAVPIDTAIKIVAELRAAGRVSRGHLGAMVQELTPELARAFGVGASSGALVTRIVHGSPAERGGLRSGDILRGIGGHVDQSYETIEKEVTGARPGEEITLDVWRRGASLRLVAVLDEAPADLPPKPSPISFRVDERLGLNLGEIRTARRVDLGIGVAVLEAHGAAARAGLLPNDVIVAVADRAVHTIAEFDAALALIPVDRPVALLVERGGVWGFVAVENGR